MPQEIIRHPHTAEDVIADELSNLRITLDRIATLLDKYLPILVKESMK